MLKNIRPTLLALICIAGSLHESAWADQTAEDRLRDQLRQTVLQLRQEQDENAELKTKSASTVVVEKPVVQKVDKASRAQTEQAKEQARQQQARADGLQTQLDDAHTQLAQLQAALTQSGQALHAQQLATQDAEARASALQGVAAHEKACVEDNHKLVVIGIELQERYDDAGIWDVLWSHEPLTGIPGLEREKLMQQYHARIVDATVVPMTADSGAGYGALRNRPAMSVAAHN